MASPLILATLLLWGGRPNISMASARPSIDVNGAGDPGASARPPAIPITIDSSALVPYAECEHPVVLPGYLLPDDGCEESAHAGS